MKKIIALLLGFGFTVLFGLPGHCSTAEFERTKVPQVDLVYQVTTLIATPVADQVMVLMVAVKTTCLKVAAPEVNRFIAVSVPESVRHPLFLYWRGLRQFKSNDQLAYQSKAILFKPDGAEKFLFRPDDRIDKVRVKS